MLRFLDDGPVQKMEYRTGNESHFIMYAYFCVSEDELEVSEQFGLISHEKRGQRVINRHDKDVSFVNPPAVFEAQTSDVSLPVTEFFTGRSTRYVLLTIPFPHTVIISSNYHHFPVKTLELQKQHRSCAIRSCSWSGILTQNPRCGLKELVAPSDELEYLHLHMYVVSRGYQRREAYYSGDRYR